MLQSSSWSIPKYQIKAAMYTKGVMVQKASKKSIVIEWSAMGKGRQNTIIDIWVYRRGTVSVCGSREGHQDGKQEMKQVTN